MSNLRVFKKGEIELTRLTIFAELCNSSEHNDGRFDISVCEMYFDYGQNWKYVGLLTTDLNDGIRGIRDWQSFCPRTHDLICNCDSISKLKEMADYYVKSLYESSTGSQLYDVFE